MPSGPIHLHIADVLTAVPAQIGVEAGLVKLTEDEAPYRSLRIIIGQPEARAISAGWHGAVPGRPSTWDLFVSAVAMLGGRIDRVVITAVHEERHYYAHLELEQEGDRRILACRPSDALALAVRAYNVDILAEPSVLEAAGVLPDGTKPGKSQAGEPSESDTVAGREAALAAREAELAAREQALLARERAGGEAGALQSVSTDARPDADAPGRDDPPGHPDVPPGHPDVPPGHPEEAPEALPPELPSIPARPEVPPRPEAPPPEIPGRRLPSEIPFTPPPDLPPLPPETPVPPGIPGTPLPPEGPSSPPPGGPTA